MCCYILNINVMLNIIYSLSSSWCLTFTIWFHPLLPFYVLQYLLSVATATSCSQQCQISKICDLESGNNYHTKQAILDNIYMQVPTWIPPKLSSFISGRCHLQTPQRLISLDFLSIQNLSIDSTTQFVKKRKKLRLRTAFQMTCDSSERWLCQNLDSGLSKQLASGSWRMSNFTGWLCLQTLCGFLLLYCFYLGLFQGNSASILLLKRKKRR